MPATVHALRALLVVNGLMSVLSVAGFLDMNSTECVLLALAALGSLVAIVVRARRN